MDTIGNQTLGLGWNPNHNLSESQNEIDHDTSPRATRSRRRSLGRTVQFVLRVVSEFIIMNYLPSSLLTNDNLNTTQNRYQRIKSSIWLYLFWLITGLKY